VAVAPGASATPGARPAGGSAGDPGPDRGPDPASGDAAAVVAPGEPLSAEDDARRQEGLRAFDAGRFTEAREIFDALLQRHRSNASLQALAAAARTAESQAREGAAVTLARMPARPLEEPPWTRKLVRAAPIGAQGPAPKLVKVSETRNQITDDAEWFSRHGLALPQWEVPNRFRNAEGTLPSQVPDRYGDLPIVTALSHPDHAVLMYGPDYSGGTVVAVVAGNGEVRGLFDFEAWRRAPKTAPGDADFVDQRVAWAQAVDGVLFVSTGHNTYAKSSGGATGYISAIDLATGELLWRSDPLVANARNFLVHDGWIITGYGFTAEPDFLFVLDARTGEVKSKQRLKSGPSAIVLKDTRLFVRTYDTDYELELR
jgi:hypothetical protein